MTETMPAVKAELKPDPSKAALKRERMRAFQFKHMLALVNRVRLLPSGERLFVRFDQADVLEHWVLMGAFALLAFTGVLRMHAFGKISATLITFFFRNINNAHSIHDAAAVLYGGLMVVHIIRSLYAWFVKSDPDILVPARRDFGDFVNAAKYLFSRTSPRPTYGRFSVEQKLTYWTVALFSIFMLLTALIQTLQAYLVPFMPDAALPIIRVLHRSLGLLSVVTLLPWHLYHTLLKERNFSIFRGVVDEPTIQYDHPLEFQQIAGALAAYQEYRNSPSTAVRTTPEVDKQVYGGLTETAGDQGQK